MNALTSRAVKNFSTASKGATSVLETLVRIIWICESKRKGLLTSQSKVMVQNVSERSFFTFHYHFEGKSVPWTLKSRVFQVSALTSRALKKFSTASKGATAVLETVFRIIWIYESKREGLLTSQSKVMVQNVSERSFFTFHYHFEGKFDVDKKWATTRFGCNTFFSWSLKNYLLIQSSTDCMEF